MISIVDYDVCNLASIENMLKQINFKAKITKNPEEIFKSKLIILPGVGSFDEGMKNLKKNNLDKVIIEFNKQKKNILGICLGMQLLFKKSEEGELNGLGLLNGEIKKFDSNKLKVNVPHMGWNYVDINKNSKFFFEHSSKLKFYFAHSYYAECKDLNLEAGTTNYGKVFCSIVENSHLFGVQFHPEKSHNYGKSLLKNILKNVT
tara:strand:+ start:849 stop:1460 length:612 start_codon:yes stop_codon:yes gene_type:complete